VHAALRAGLVKRFGEAGKGVRLLYGGAVKPDNAKEQMFAANEIAMEAVCFLTRESQDHLGARREIKERFGRIHVTI